MSGGYGLGTFSCVRRLGRIGQGGVSLLFWISSFGLDLSVKVSELYSMDMEDITRMGSCFLVIQVTWVFVVLGDAPFFIFWEVEEDFPDFIYWCVYDDRF